MKMVSPEIRKSLISLLIKKNTLRKESCLSGILPSDSSLFFGSSQNFLSHFSTTLNYNDFIIKTIDIAIYKNQGASITIENRKNFG